MKRKIILFTFLIFTAFSSQKIFSQQLGLTIVSVDSFPVLPDTAYENQSDSFSIRVINLDSSQLVVNDYLRVFLRNADSTNLTQPEQVIDSVFINTLSGGDTINFNINGYIFTTATYRAGNNIVVVWPRIGSNTGSTHDSLQLDTVYFKLLLAINMLNGQNQVLSVFPNPVTDKITINSDDEKFVDYVRILNDLGQEIFFRKSAVRNLDVRFLSEGFYFIEVKDRSGTISRKKFLKL